MMLNQIVLVGRITKTPEMMENQDGSKFSIINLAVPRTFKYKNGEHDTDFIDCTLLGSIAINTYEYCKKGDLVSIKGRIQNLNNTAQLQIIADKVTFVSSSKEK